MPRSLIKGMNPVHKIPQVIVGHEGEMYMDPVVHVVGNAEGYVEGNANGVAAGTVSEQPVQQQMTVLYSVEMQV